MISRNEAERAVLREVGHALRTLRAKRINAQAWDDVFVLALFADSPDYYELYTTHLGIDSPYFRGVGLAECLRRIRPQAVAKETVADIMARLKKVCKLPP